MAKIFEANNISKVYTDSFGYSTHLLEDVSFELEEGSITSILAPTGSGKSSLLRIVSGLENGSSGNISPAANKKIIYIPSQPSSFPWYSVKENIMLVTDNEEKAASIIKAVGLEGYENHFPDNNSLGFRLRISLARALAVDADLIVLDEPFNKDIKPVTLERIYELVLNIRKNFGVTFLIGTSNLTESILLSDKIYLMKKSPGKIVEQLNIVFEEERNLEIMKSKKFFEYRNNIEVLLKKIVSQRFSNITV